jgi:transcriptional regulator with XRE-family HTH domain
MKLFNFSVDPRAVREKAGLNQQEFWTKIGVTQSGGSRYESGRQMPKPVRELLRLVHIEKLDLSKVRKEDFEVIEYLKASHPDLYKSLRKAVKSRGKRPNGGTGTTELDD